MNRLATYAFRKLFAGVRLGQPTVASLGAAISLISWLRRRNAQRGRELVYSKRLKEGQAIGIRMRQGDTIVDERVVEG